AGFKLFADEKNAAALVARVEAGLRPAGTGRSPAITQSGTTSGGALKNYLRAHLGRIGAGDYFAVLGYLEMNAEHESLLQDLRMAVRNRKRVATCLGFGPRFLHSTGQAYKGGPNSGVFLQVTCDDAQDLPVPGQQYTFGVVKAAQARGDFQVLAGRGRRALRVHLPEDLDGGLTKLAEAFHQALG